MEKSRFWLCKTIKRNRNDEFLVIYKNGINFLNGLYYPAQLDEAQVFISLGPNKKSSGLDLVYLPNWWRERQLIHADVAMDCRVDPSKLITVKVNRGLIGLKIEPKSNTNSV